MTNEPLRIPDPRDKPWLTVAELCAITGEGEKTIRAALAAGQLPCLDVGRFKRIPTAALLAVLGIEPTAPTSAPEAWASVHPLPGVGGP
ncbi:helix-turn-helix domain-containing protein [Nocardioides psychrotolerans]|uniref:DNA binding domain-containing protein, excisionase family n=1 Tax=Nocardioides psychrotolerans TaxID=1005945 RepID=A0A1I3I7K0_9ACTN|nr:helix-turn-helix domain-containing protein [Nocardioides psychrotolerans]SFI43968.1 DNA binding domain-containing protein, excisionase family [Nocardioides psychrotolerans]